MQSSVENIKIFRDAVNSIGVGKWHKIANYLKLQNIHIDKEHSLYTLWLKIRTNQSQENMTKMAELASIQILENDFDVTKVKPLPDLPVADYIDHGKRAMINSLRTLVSVYARQKTKCRNYFSLGTGTNKRFRYHSLKKYNEVLKLESDDALIISMKKHAQKFKEITINMLKLGIHNQTRKIKFQYLITVIKRHEAETMINQISYFSEMLRMKDKSATQDSDLMGFSPLVPKTLAEIKQSAIYQLMFLHQYEVYMFNKFLAAQSQQIFEQEQQEEQFSVEICQTSSKPKPPKKNQLQTPVVNPQNFKRRHPSLAYMREKQMSWDTAKFAVSIKEDFEQEQNYEDSFEFELPSNEIEKIISHAKDTDNSSKSFKKSGKPPQEKPPQQKSSSRKNCDK